MRERPILFAGPMVRAILNGEKTVTRPVMKPQPKVTEAYLREHEAWVEGLTLSDHVNNAWQSGFIDVACPYGEPGDRLWVRESTSEDVIGSQSVTRYTADGATRNHPWRYSRSACPSIHMPRSASRILLKIIGVRVERLQDISDDQARAEGVAEWAKGALSPEGRADICRQDGFRMLWESINGAESWAANPWVWVIEFRRIAA